jgi:[acyl-carrier-protein] S-malonyltransferase
MGPGKALTGFLRRIDRTAQALNVADIPSLDATLRALDEPLAR